jgi:electron transport complex protein RnfC
MFKKIKWGIHADTHKTPTESKAIENGQLPSKVVLPVRQHIGAPCEPLVKKGALVKKGQVIASSDAPVSSNIHATISGTVIDVSNKPHPGLGEALAITIESDGLDQWEEGVLVERDWETLSAEELIEIIKNAGIVGLGGAAFPTHIKLQPPKEAEINTLIINGAECEPYLTSDHRMMLEYTDRLIKGVLILKKVLGVNEAIIGIEDNKMNAVEAITAALPDGSIKVVAVPSKYPQGGEKMLINTLINREVPSGKLPLDVGVVVQNVATAVAVCDAVQHGIPLIERIVTVSGSAIKEPKNLKLRIGTSFADAIEQCGGFNFEPEKILMGGPFMGTAQYTTEVPIIKGVNGILALSKEDLNSGTETNCIRCGRCVEACPMGLNPTMISALAEKGLFTEAKEEYHVLDCIECGACTYVCPAKRKLTHYCRYAKFSAAKGGK